jgi:hypothetical protein
MDSLLFILRRARRHWQILLTLTLGVILAIALLSSGPLLVDAVIEMGLHLALESAGVTDANLRLVPAAAVSQADAQLLDGEVRDLLQTALAAHLDRVIWSAQSDSVHPWIDGEPAADLRVYLRAYQGIQGTLEYVAGQWPESSNGETGAIRVVIPDAMARSLALRAGDRLPISLGRGGTGPDAWLEVTGIVHPKDPLDPYWFGEFSPLTSQSAPGSPLYYSAILPEDALFPVAASLFPTDTVEVSWHVLLRHDSLSAADLEPFQGRLEGLQAGLDALRPQVALWTGVPGILLRFQTQLESIRIPLYILIAEVMLLAL